MMFLFFLSHWGWFASGTGGFAGLVALASAIGPASLLTHWKTVMEIVVVLAVAVTIALLVMALQLADCRLGKALKNYATVSAENQTLNSVNANLVQQVQLQNKAIALLAADAQAAKKASEAALAAAATKQVSDQASIAALQKRIADPQTNTGSCDDEVVRLRDSL